MERLTYDTPEQCLFGAVTTVPPGIGGRSFEMPGVKVIVPPRKTVEPAF